MKIIDPHIHLFDINQGDYYWLKPDNPPFWVDKSLINRNFNECDLQLASPNALSGFVHIEAGFNNVEPQREIQWLESTLTTPFRSIAYLDITLSSSLFLKAINQLSAYKSVVGIRYILDDNASDLFNNAQALTNLSSLADYGLLFEAQLSLSNTSTVNALSHFLNNQNQLNVIINHAGITSDASIKNANTSTSTKSSTIAETTWLGAIKTLAAFNHCAIKCSGWELSNRNYTQQTQINVINTCLKYFGENRVMLASNFPLVIFSQSYNDYWKNLAECDQWNNEIKHKIFYQNSYCWYGF